MEYISFYFLQVVDLMIYGVLSFSLYDHYLKKNKYYHMLLWFSLSFILFVLRVSDFAGFDTIYVLCMICYFILILNVDFFKRIRMIFVILMIVLFVQSTVMLFFEVDTSFSYEINFLSITNAIVLLFVSGIIYFVRKNKKGIIDWADIPTYLYLNIIIAFLGVMFPLISVAWMKEFLTLKLNIAIVSVSYLVAICSAITIVLYIKNYNERNKYFNESQIKEQLLDMQKKYYLDLVKNYEDIRKFKHDFKAHMRVIKTLEENNNYRELHEYIGNIQSEMQKVASFKCNNIFVSAIVNSFVLQCQENKILLDVTFDVNGNININNVHLCSLLHNLLSNAIEEQLKIERTDKRLIVLNIINSSRVLMIDMNNNVSDDFDIDNIVSKKTSKKDYKNHGIGLYNIYGIVDIYYGDVEYSQKNKKLNTNIILPNCVNES